MKKAATRKAKASDNELRAEYDLSGGVRSKDAKRLREKGYIIRVFEADDTFTEKRVLPESLMVIEPDVWAHFPDSAAVNHRLRTLISLVAEKIRAAANG